MKKQLAERKWVRYAAFLLVFTALCGNLLIAQPSQTPTLPLPNAGKIELAPSLIPRVPAALPVLRLTSQKAPVEFMKDVLGKVGAKAETVGPLSRMAELASREKPLPDYLVGAMVDRQLVGYWNEQTGDAEVFPILEKQKPVPVEKRGEISKRAAALAKETFGRPGMLAKDATQAVFGEPLPLLGTTAERKSGEEKVAESPQMLYMTYVPVHRTVGGHRVYGPGSRALLAVGNDGSVQGFLRSWKTGAAAGEVREGRSAEQVRGEIQRVLEPFAQTADVTVLTVEVAYYDGNRDVMQPVYRITSRLHFLPAAVNGVGRSEKPVADDFVVSYVPFGSEALPPASKPILPTWNLPATVRGAPGDPTVGRYVVRNDDSDWVADANEFWSGLTILFGNLFFTNAQYYWAHPFEFTTNELQFANSVQITLVEAHGDWWYFTTYQNWGDGVDLTAIPASQGYGRAANGQMDYFILHSCEVVPSAADAPCPTDNRPWWTPWFNIFQGLHSVVGYRTIMYIDDDVGGPFGVNLRFGVSVVSAWFNATLSAPDYASHPTSTAHCGKALPMGKPSTVSMCGRAGDSAYDTTVLPAANCLVNFWQPD